MLKLQNDGPVARVTMNELTQSLLRQVWIEAKGTTTAKSFAHFERAVRDRYWSHVRAIVGMRMSEQAALLARHLWMYPGCFDPDDPCDNCSILLADTLSRHCFWWRLDPFNEQDQFALRGCTLDAQLALW